MGGSLDDQLVGPVYGRPQLVNDLTMEMGGYMIDIELDADHYDYAINTALDKYRQRSSNSVEERFIFLELQVDQSDYYLPHEIVEVRQILRRGIGTQGSTGTNMDPFAMSYTNLWLRDAGNVHGGLLTFELMGQYQKTAGMMFGREITFQFDRVTHRLTVDREIRQAETVGLWAFTFRPEVDLLNDQYARPWIRAYALARCKLMLAMAYGKFQTIVGPQGGSSLPADSLKADAQQELDKLEEEIKNYIEGSNGLTFVIG